MGNICILVFVVWVGSVLLGLHVPFEAEGKLFCSLSKSDLVMPRLGELSTPQASHLWNM